MSVKLGAFVPLPFDTRGWDDAEGAGMARCQVMHSRRIRSVGTKLERFRWTRAEEESVEHGSPLAMWINWHGNKDGFAEYELTNERLRILYPRSRRH